MKKIISAITLFFAANLAFAQGYEIKITIKGIKDSVCYLTRYKWDGQYFADTAKVKNGTMIFKGKTPLEKGLYSVLKAGKNAIYFDLPFVPETPKFSIVTDTVNVYEKMKVTGSPTNEEFREFVVFMSGHYKQAYDYEQDVKKRKDADSTKLIRADKGKHFEEIKKFQKDFIAKHATSYVSTLIRLQTEPEIPEAPKAKNGRPDSTWQYQYLVTHYWDGIPLNDVGTVNNNKLFYNHLKTWYEKVLIQAPDTLIKYGDWLADKTGDNKEMFKFVVFYLTRQSEDSKIMGHDAVFVHLINKYYRTKKAYWVDEATNKKIIERGDILEPILLGNKAPDMDMIDTTGARFIKKLGMDTITSSERLTNVFMNNLQELQKLFVPLHKVKADYTVVVFYDVDCGHCQKDLPKLKTTYDKMKGEGKSVEVYAVYTHFDTDKWKKFIRDNKLNWINVYNGVHLVDLKTKFDIYSTPRIFILDKDKIIKAKGIGEEQVEDVINSFIKQSKKP